MTTSGTGGSGAGANDRGTLGADRWLGRVYEFAGQWGVPSRCSLFTTVREGRFVAVATELYGENPGSSVTSMASSVVAALAVEHGIAEDQITLIVRCPGRGSKLSCYDETFDRYVRDPNERPRWERMTSDEVATLVG
ncbi:MAG: hypothetical protein JW751_04700 [Polyangiaceae bacterium]|nr:hypothetical protein [Polyangiaceae bacterium]